LGGPFGAGTGVPKGVGSGVGDFVGSGVGVTVGTDLITKGETFLTVIARIPDINIKSIPNEIVIFLNIISPMKLVVSFKILASIGLRCMYDGKQYNHLGVWVVRQFWQGHRAKTETVFRRHAVKPVKSARSH